ncbi:hypothetical protein BGZ46_000314, partial [Entomortierella lignicola]
LANFSDIFTGRLRSEIPDCLVAFGDALKDKKHLVELNLSDNAFGAAGVNPLVEFLTTNRNLQILKLNNNGLGVTGGKVLAQALMTAQERNVAENKKSSLRVIIAGRNRLENGSTPDLAKAFAAHGTLTHVAMPQNGIRMEGIEALAAGLTKCPGLEILDLQDNTFTIRGCRAFAAAIPTWSGLKRLNFGECLLSNKGTILLSQALAQGKNTKLESIDFTFAEMRENGVLELASVISGHLPNLTKLELNGNQVEEDSASIDAVRDALSRHNHHDALGDLDDMEEPDSDEDKDEDEEEEEEGEEKDEKSVEDELAELTAKLNSQLDLVLKKAHTYLKDLAHKVQNSTDKAQIASWKNDTAKCQREMVNHIMEFFNHTESRRDALIVRARQRAIIAARDGVEALPSENDVRIKWAILQSLDINEAQGTIHKALETARSKAKVTNASTNPYSPPSGGGNGGSDPYADDFEELGFFLDKFVLQLCPPPTYAEAVSKGTVQMVQIILTDAWRENRRVIRTNWNPPLPIRPILIMALDHHVNEGVITRRQADLILRAITTTTIEQKRNRPPLWLNLDLRSEVRSLEAREDKYDYLSDDVGWDEVMDPQYSRYDTDYPFM